MNLLARAIDLLCGAESGFVSGSMPDVDWRITKDKLLKDYREARASAQGAPEPVAWRYQRKIGWGDIWRCSTVPVNFETPDHWIVEPLYALTSTERCCQKCGSPTKGEEAYVDGQIWCHPCADEVALPSTVRGDT